MVSETILAMKPVRALVRAMQRFFRAHEDWDVRAAEFRGEECIARGLLNGYVPGNRGNCQHAYLRRAQRHDQGHGVIGSGVGINQEKRFHAA